jgi:putative copper export protein/methionine-rich copper-binding protein CopC
MRLLRTALLLLAVLLGSAWAATAAFAQAPPSGTADQTVPAANQTLTTAPKQIEVSPADGATSGTATVFESNGKTVAHGVLAPAGDGALGLSLPPLGTGAYLVTWSAGRGSGSFGFGISGSAASPAVVTQPKPATTLGPLQDNLVQWAPLILVMIFVGTLGLRLLVTGPASRQIHATQALIDSDRRLTQVAAAAVALLVPTEVASFAYSNGQWDFGSIWPSLGASGAGHIVGGRLAVTFLAALFVIPLAFRRSRPSMAVTIAGLSCGLLELIGREVPSSAPPDWPRTIFTTVLYCFHLFAAAVWIGGLAALLGLMLFRGIPDEARQEFWPAAIRRFSTCAMVSVGVLVLTGLWLYWVHIDGLHQLFSTLYGRTLFVKLIVVAVLVLIGGSNQFWLMPLIDAQHAAGDRGGLTRTVMRHFRAVIALEVALGLGVFFVAALLAGSARNEAFQAGPQALAQTAVSGATTVEMYPSAMQPGLIDYNVKLTGGPTPKEVSLDFTSRQRGVTSQQVTATAIGDDTYRVSGYYTPVVGDWQVSVRADDRAPTTFAFPVTAQAPTPGRATPPDVRWTTWLAGVLETLLVASVLFSSFRVSRRLTSDRIKIQRADTTPEPGLDLLGA